MDEGIQTQFELSDQEYSFIKGILDYQFNVLEAYQRAGFRKISDPAAIRAASKLLNETRIQGALNTTWYSTSQDKKIPMDRVRQEIERIAFSNIRDLVAESDDGHITFRPPEQMSDDASASVSSIKITERRNPKGIVTNICVEIKMWDKVKALALLARHHNMFEADNTRSIDVNMTTFVPDKSETEAEWLANYNLLSGIDEDRNGHSI